MGSRRDSNAQLLGRIRRQLAALEIRTQFTPRGEVLTGELLPGDALVNPLNGEPLARVTFRVGPDAELEVKSPPLVEGLRLIDCVQTSSQVGLIARLTQALHHRVGEVEALHNRLEAMGLEPEMDAERAEVAVHVDLDTTGEAVLVGGGQGLVARYVVPAMGKRDPVSLGDLVLDLAEFSDKVDLELFLACRAGEVMADAASAGAPDTVAPATGPVTSAPAKDLTLEHLAERLGPSAVLGSGFSITRTLRIDGDEARFEAHHRRGETFAVRLERRGATVWEGDFRLSELSSLDDFVADLAAKRSSPSAQTHAQHGWMDEQARLVAGLLPPAPGEIWVMDVSLEDDDGQEVRYRSLTSGGESYGAPRVLNKAAFEATFAQVGAGYRLLVRVLEVGGNYVEYQRLDAARKPVASPRRAPLIVFMASFTAEAAAY
jgi:hypothetical protein